MKFRDLEQQYQTYKTEIDTKIQTVLNNTNFIGGKEVSTLEQKLADYVGVKHCITCGNGTDAMSLVMMAWGIKAGDACFVPDFTFFASAEIVALCGATPIFVDVDQDTFNMDPGKLEQAINQVLSEGKLIPKAIIPVDLFGLPANYPEIEQLANKYDLLVLEDGAQGFGGSINGKKACSFGNAATTSFFPAKPLGCYGDGGAVFTNDDETAALIKSYKVHGKGDDKYDNVRIGLNSRLDTIQAAVLEVKLSAFINHELADVNQIYKSYNQKLQGLVKTPYIPEGFGSSFAQYTIQLKTQDQRDRLKVKLNDAGIPSMIYYTKPMHKQGAFKYLTFQEADFTVTNELCDTVLSLPMHPYLTEEEVELISRTIRSYFTE